MSLILMSSTTSMITTTYITVKITNIENTKGVIEIGLYNKESKFPNVGQTYRMARVKPEGKVLKHKFKNLKTGKYAICVYHDQNGDKKCNTNMIGVPKEPYAFSKNFRPRFSKPDFSDCMFKLNSARMITINMVN